MQDYYSLALPALLWCVCSQFIIIRGRDSRGVQGHGWTHPALPSTAHQVWPSRIHRQAAHFSGPCAILWNSSVHHEEAHLALMMNG